MKSILFSYFPLHVIFSHACSLLTAVCTSSGVEADYEPLWPGWHEKMKGYDVIGFSFVTDADYAASFPYMRAAKAAGKEVLAGGVYARRGAFIDPELVDHICRGEAEDAIAGYLKDGDTSIFGPPSLMTCIDGLPMPDLSHVTGFEFDRGWQFLQGLRILPYQTSRGCPYQCSFCEVRSQPKGIRMKHTIARDLAALGMVHHPDLFYLMDELPPYYLEEWRAQWEHIAFPFQCYIRADIEPDHLRFLIDHGLKIAAFGVESGSERFRNDVLKKHLTDFELFRTVEILRKNNVIYLPFYMTGAPGETAGDQEATRGMIGKVGGYPTVWQYQDLKASIRSV